MEFHVLNGGAGLNVLLWVPRYWPAVGGAELHSRRLACELAKSCQVRVLTHSGRMEEPLYSAAAAPGIKTIRDGRTEVIRVGLSGLPQTTMQWLAEHYSQGRAWRWLYARAFRTLFTDPVRKLAADSSLIHAVYNGLTESAELAADTAQALQQPFVWTPLACTDGPLAGAWETPRFRQLYRRAQALVALTQHERDWLIRQGAPAERVHVCPVGPLVEPASSENVRARFGIPEDAPLVLYLGRVTRDKGVERLLSAAKQVWPQHPDAHFLFVGPPDKSCQALFAASVDPRVKTWPEVSQAQKCAALNACDMLCLPSSAESLGAVLLEAWSFSKPVIAHDLPVLREVIEQGGDGLLTEHDATSLAKAIVRLIGDVPMRQALGQAGQQKLTQHYSWDVIGRRMQAIYAAARDCL